jgi:pimeloyl-ACP methyl ester carboxylesterase
MLLNLRRWGPPRASSVVCVHGLTQHGGVFEALGRRLAETGHPVVAVDLRGHGESGHQPPWDIGTHVRDVLQTLDTHGVRQVVWIGHSFGGRVAAAAAAEAPERTERLVLLDPGLRVPPERALRGAEVDRLDWSFESEEGAVNALLGNDGLTPASKEAIAAYARADVHRGEDGRYRFSFCPSAAVTAWSEMTLPPPPIAPVPTLIIQAEGSFLDPELEARYLDQLGGRLTTAKVPHGHNMLWESPRETTRAIESYLRSDAWEEDPIPGYVGDGGFFQPLL